LIAIAVDGNPLATCKNTTSCSATWKKNQISQGVHSIGAIAVDNSGLNANSSVSILTLQ
jgi:hypothetical protein